MRACSWKRSACIVGKSRPMNNLGYHFFSGAMHLFFIIETRCLTRHVSLIWPVWPVIKPQRSVCLYFPTLGSGDGPPPLALSMCTGDQTQALMFVWQALYQLSYLQSPCYKKKPTQLFCKMPLPLEFCDYKFLLKPTDLANGIIRWNHFES